MDLLIYETVLDRESAILDRVDAGIDIHKVRSIDKLYSQLDNNFYNIVILNLDSLNTSTIIDILQYIRGLYPDIFLIGTTNTKSDQLLKKIASYRVYIIEYNDGGLHDLAVLLNYFKEQQICYTTDDDRKEDINFIGDSIVIKDIIKQISLIKDSDVHLLLTGETGSGKTELARYIHINSKRKRSPFMHINCAAIPDNLLESELFGYRKGAFTGAVGNRAGKFQAARNGTICLDEIGEIPSHLQAKLLKVLDEKLYYPVGSTTAERVRARIIAATNKDLTKAVKAKKFREDLFYRLNTFEIHIPALRERREDLPALFDFFIEKYARSNKTLIPEINKQVYEILQDYRWGGNVRELQNVVQSILCLKPDKIDIAHLPKELFSSEKALLIKAASVSRSLEDLKKEYAKYMYKKAENNKLKTARILNIDIKTLRKLLK